MIFLSEKEIENILLSPKSYLFFYKEGKSFSESSILGLNEILNYIYNYFKDNNYKNISFENIKYYFKHHIYHNVKNIFINYFEIKSKEEFIIYNFYKYKNTHIINLLNNNIIEMFEKFKYIYFYFFIIGYFYNLLNKLNINKNDIVKYINLKLKLLL